ncbi:MAG: hypothetical protein ACK5RO_07800 [Pseudobdellovibrionaceae bacterium]
MLSGTNMRNLYVLALVVLVSVGLGLSFWFGQTERSELVVAPHSLQSLEGFQTQLPLSRENLALYSHVVFGIQPEAREHQQALPILLQALTQSGLPFESLVIDSTLGLDQTQFPGATWVNFSTEASSFLDQYGALLTSQRKVIFILSNFQSSQLVKGNFVDGLKQRLGLSVLSFSFVRVPQYREHEGRLEISCSVSVADNVGSGSLGCQMLQLARRFYYRWPKEGQYLFALEKVQASDWLIYLQQPQRL